MKTDSKIRNSDEEIIKNLLIDEITAYKFELKDIE